MASFSSPSPPTRMTGGQNSNSISNSKDDNDLAHSLKHLSLATKPPNGTSSRSPSAMSFRNAPRSPLNNGRPESRSGTPALLRKASLNSLRSVGVGGVAAPRRASSVNMSPSMMRSPLGGGSPPEEKPAPTAASVASGYFKTELAARHGDTPDPTSETVVILHDSCYGHRYSRPKTSRVALGTIVERPERLKASALGVASAYVRLGGRHADGNHPVYPDLDPRSIPSIPFRIHKTTRRLPLGSQTVTNVHGQKWMEELKMMCDSAEAKLAMNGKELQRPDINRGPDQETPQKFHEGDLYLCAESLDALEGSLGGLCEAVDAVFQQSNPAKRAFVAIRPPGHHCSASYPAGFCWINNVQVGIMHAILSHGLTHAAIIDFDLHHGDGSQTIAWQHNARGVGLAKNAAWWKKTSIGYFSLHDINSFPCEGGDEEKVKNASLCIENAHGQNIWNVHLQPWRNQEEFWKLYETKYSVLLEKTRDFLKGQTERFRAANQHFKGAIFLSAGFDASEHEGEGMQRHKVNVPTEFYARLTRDVVKIAAEEGTSVDGRVISVLEGGYSDRALTSGILSHLSGLAGDDPVPTKESQYNGLGYEMGHRIGSTHSRRESVGPKSLVAPLHPYEPDWWSKSQLEELEATMACLPSAEAKKPRNLTPPTYSSPTQSSTAKALATPKVRRSFSNMSMGNGSPISRAPTPPPPDVSWAVAAHELSKLLIPDNRQTMSCRYEDLSAEATKQRRDRQSMALGAELGAGESAASRPPTRMSLRERKATKSYLEEEDDEEFDMAIKDRRKTIAGASVLASEKAAARGVPQPGRPRQSVRRLSAASTVVSESTDKASPPQVLQPGVIGAEGLTTGARSETSQSVRLESSMSVRNNTAAAPAAGSLPVKKTRVAAVKKEPATTRAPRAPKKSTAATAAPTRITSSAKLGQGASAPATPKASTASAAILPSAPSTVPANKIGPPAVPQQNGSSAGQTDDLDSITSGMKKIRINLITKSQKEARGKVDKGKGKATGSTSASPSPSVPEPPTAPAAQASQEPSDSGVKSELVTPLPSPLPQDLPLPGSSPAPPHAMHLPGQPTATPPSSSPQPSTPGLFVSYQPEGPTPRSFTAQQQQQEEREPPPLQWLPPNTGTPSPMKPKDVPVFTATSSIPFAGGSSSSALPSAAAAAAAARPHQQQGASTKPAMRSPPVLSPTLPKGEDGDDEKRLRGENGSIWDVPKTPQK